MNENEWDELHKELNWRKIMHNHIDIFGHNTCALCVIENALYGYKKGENNEHSK